MFVYGVCVGPTNKFGDFCEPSLIRNRLSPVLARREQRSIFEAYSSIIEEALSTWPDLEGVVLLHDDVEVVEPDLEAKLRGVFSDPAVGAVGVVGGRNNTEMSWWMTDELFGHVRHAQHTDDFTRGDHEVSTIDGLFIALSPAGARACQLRQGGYPAWHGYDSEICETIRQANLKVMVTDLELFHDCKPGPWRSPAYGQAIMEWNIRWKNGSKVESAKWRVHRAALALAARVRS
jgi:hypothetical protein